jgi:hypothetical protein
MTELDSVLVEEAKFALHGRILRCPLGDNPEDCPLHELRKLPVEKRVAWLESQTDEEIISLYDRHIECLECKLEEYGTES